MILILVLENPIKALKMDAFKVKLLLPLCFCKCEIAAQGAPVIFEGDETHRRKQMIAFAMKQRVNLAFWHQVAKANGGGKPVWLTIDRRVN